MANLFLGRWLSRGIRERREDGKIGFGQGVNAHVSYFISAFVAKKNLLPKAFLKNSGKTRRLKS
jgi:hypothetical protein